MRRAPVLGQGSACAREGYLQAFDLFVLHLAAVAVPTFCLLCVLEMLIEIGMCQRPAHASPWCILAMELNRLVVPFLHSSEQAGGLLLRVCVPCWTVHRFDVPESRDSRCAIDSPISRTTPKLFVILIGTAISYLLLASLLDFTGPQHLRPLRMI